MSDFCNPPHSVNIDAYPSEVTYYLVVSGETSSDFGNFELVIWTNRNHESGPPQGSCPFATATWIDYNEHGMLISGTTSGYPSLSLLSSSSCNQRGSSAVFYFQAVASVDIAVTTCSFESDYVITVFRAIDSGDDCDALCLGNNDNHPIPDEDGTQDCDPGMRSSTFLVEGTPSASNVEGDALEIYYIAVTAIDKGASNVTGASNEFELIVLPLFN